MLRSLATRKARTVSSKVSNFQKPKRRKIIPYLRSNVKVSEDLKDVSIEGEDMGGIVFVDKFMS